MIEVNLLENIAKKEQTSVFPNIIREYIQHLFLTELYQFPGSEKLLFKGGTALRIVYNSPRFSEDLDFSLFEVPNNEVEVFIENLFLNVLAKLESTGIHIEINNKSAITSGGYFGLATLHTNNYPPINIEINVNSHDREKMKGEIDSISNNFVPTYTLYHLPQNDLVNEKVFLALMQRKKPRDYYDLYIIMRKGMLSPDQKTQLGKIAREIIENAKQIDFQEELGTFLPINQQSIIRDFSKTLEREMQNQLSLN